MKIKETYLGIIDYYDNLDQVIQINHDVLEDEIAYIDNLKDVEEILEEKYDGMTYPEYEILEKYELETIEDGRENRYYFDTEEEAKKKIKELIKYSNEYKMTSLQLNEWFEDETNRMLDWWEI